MISGQIFAEVEYNSFKDTLIDYSKRDLSKTALGTVYNRLALMNQQEGNWLGYYTNFGKSAYYLEESENYNDEINLYCDLVYYVYFANENFDSAETVMKKINLLAEKCINLNNQTEALIYQRQALLSYYRGDYNYAVYQAQKSQKTVEKLDEVYSQSFYDAAQFIIAKAFIEQNDYSAAEELLESQKDSPGFVYGNEFSMINTNFIIPYYQLKAYVSAHNGNEEELRSCLNEIFQRATKFDFEYAVYDTLKILRKHNTFSPEFSEWISEQELEVYKNFIKEKSQFYTAICNALIDSNYQETLAKENERETDLRQGRTMLVLVIFLILLGIFTFVLRKKLYTDVLTGVGNRRSFDIVVKRNKRKHTEYAVIMIDIDDFKQVNDTFGHEEGDKVLRRIGSIILERKESRRILPYRYGGEEFVILVYDEYIAQGKAIAESIRHQVECQKWEKEETLTISAGFAEKVDMADKNLYIAKKSGKNQVV